MLTGPRPTAGDHGDTGAVIFAQEIWDALRDPTKSQFICGPGIRMDKQADGRYRVSVDRSRAGGPGGGFMGEYDQTQSYFAGQTFKISSATTIDSIAVVAGYYGVPPAGTDVLGKVWAGFVPANPTGNAVPQFPLPTIGAAPNDKFYADLIGEYCDA